MRFVPRAEPAEQNGSARETVGDYLGALVRSKGFSVEGFRQRFHISLQGNVSRQLDVTREKFEAVLNALEIPEQERDAHWQEYVGSFPRTMPGIITAGIRRYGLEKMEELSGVSRSTVYSIAHGEQHSGRKQRERHYPPLATWVAVAGTMNVSADEAERIWNEEMKAHFMQEEGLNELGAETEMLIRSSGLSFKTWRKAENRPAGLRSLTSRKADEAVREMRAGVPRAWEEVEALLVAAGASEERAQRVADAWVEEIVRTEGLLTDRPMPNAEAERDPQASDHLIALRQSIQMKLREKVGNLIDTLARNGDTQFGPGTPERVAIIEHRYEHGLPLHHPEDLKIEHASGTGIERGPARTFGMKF